MKRGTEEATPDTQCEKRGESGLVGVVIPCYNQARFLGEAIESVLSQSYRDFEIIVVDDGSTDDTAQVASRYEADHKEVRLIRQENRGLAGARNRGLEEAKGEYVVFLDSDDRLLPGAFQAGLDCFAAHPECAFVYGQCRLIDVEGSPLFTALQPRIDHNPYKSLLHNNYIWMHATVMYRRWVLTMSGAFDTSLDACEDYDLYLRVARRYPVRSYNKIVTEYRQHSGNMTGDWARMLRCALEVLRSQWEHVKGDEEYEKAYREGVRLWQEKYGDPLAQEVRSRIERREWGRVLKGVLVLGRYFPRGLALVVTKRRLQRRKLTRQLESLREQILLYERRLRGRRRLLQSLEGRAGGNQPESEWKIEELEQLIDAEDLEVKRLKRRTERLALQLQELDRRGRTGLISPIWGRLMVAPRTGQSADRRRDKQLRMGGSQNEARHLRGQRRGGEAGLVSVVIPCYNQARFLGEAIESVLSQSHRDFEIVVVDDGSTDETAEVASRYERVRLFQQENQGLAGARNRGLGEAKGEFVVFLDADDRLLPGALEAGLRCFEAHPECAFVSGTSRPIAEDGTLLSQRSDTVVEGDHYLKLLRRNYIWMHATVMYRRSVFDDVGGFDVTLRACEDYDHYLRVARRYPVQRHDELVAEYRQHRANMSRDPALMLTSALTALHRQRKFVKDNEHYRKAFKFGDRFWRESYGDLLVGEVRMQMRAGNWEQVLRGVSVLGRYYRQGLILLLGARRMEWHKLSQELRTCREQLQARNQRILELRRELTQQRQRANRLAKRSKGMLEKKGKADPQKQDAGKGRRGRPPVGKVDFGSLRRLNPISFQFGYDRGRPVDRYYIENFLAYHAGDIKGRVLEVGDDSYTCQFGGGRVEVSDVLHVTEGNPQSTIVADLSRADNVPSGAFDCIIFTQTLQFIYDVRLAIQTLRRILRPGGVLLATVPSIGRMLDPSQDEWDTQYYWAFTPASVRLLFEESFPATNVEVEAHGNVLAAISFLHGLAAEELREQELKSRTPGYEVIVTVRAVKPGAALT